MGYRSIDNGKDFSIYRGEDRATCGGAIFPHQVQRIQFYAPMQATSVATGDPPTAFHRHGQRQALLLRCGGRHGLKTGGTMR